MDDGSEDDSIEQVWKWRERINCARFEILTPSRMGKPGLVRNYGLAQAQGQFLLCLDPDDTLHSGYLEACVSALGDNERVSVVYTNYSENRAEGSREVALPKFTQALLRTQNGCLLRQ